jgi:DNA-binding CsgD family transcriptional regulator
MVGRISSPRFIGRAAELEALEGLLASAASGSGGAMLVAGEAGIGKSRLIAELQARARGVDGLVLLGECVELAEGELAFSPIISALRGVVEDGEALDGLSDPLRGSLAALWSLPGRGAVVAGGREQLFEAVYRVLARFAARRPVLLVIEDVHWIDRSSRDLLAFLVRAARRDPIAVVLTYRPDELHKGHPLRPFVAELERSGQARRIDLQPLAAFEVAEQLQAIAGHVHDGQVVERIFARSEGNPFFAEELLAATQGGGEQLPESLRETLLLRVEQLSPPARKVLTAAAVAGRSVDHRLLSRVVGFPEPELLGGLREATDHHVLVSSADGISYAFRHALLREAIYEDALGGERLRLHRAIAETLAAHREYAGPAAAAELAHHWHAAGERGAALSASLEAVDEAQRMHAYGEALAHVERVLSLWDEVEDPAAVAGADRVELLLRGSQLADWAGDSARAVALAEQARGALDGRIEPVRAAAAEMMIGRAMHFAGRGADAIEHLTKARRLVPREPPSLEYAEVLAAEGRVLMLNDRCREAQDRLEEAVALARELEARVLEANALNSLAGAYGATGEHERAITSGRQGLAIAQETGSPYEIVRAYINCSQAIDNAGRIEESLALGMEGILGAERLGMGHSSGDQLRLQAEWRLLRMGRLEDAERMLQTLLDGATSPFIVAGAEADAGYLAAERGEFDVAERRLEHAWELMQRAGVQVIAGAGTYRVLLQLQLGELAGAHERLAEGLSVVMGAEGNLINTAPLFWLAARVAAEFAESADRSGGGEAAADTATVALAEFDRAIELAGGDRAPPEALAFRALAEAELTRVRGEHDPQSWHEAAELFRALSEPLNAAYADLRAAEAIALSGGRAVEIAGPLRSAFVVASTLGSRPLRDEAEALARRAGIALEPAEPSDARAPAELGLTHRELEVLRLLAEGRTNRQIGDELFITPKTASVHVSRILMKLGVANRAEAAAVAHRMGIARPLAVD